MIEDNKNIKLINYNDNNVLWRYMDFTKFVSLLQNASLFFCACSKMQDLDPYEGAYPKQNLEQLSNKKNLVKLPKEYFKKPSSYRNKFLQNIGMNCWHANDTESAAMWKLYLSSNDGLAIKTTIKNLKASFDENNNDVVYIGEISYNNYQFSSFEMDYIKYIGEVKELADKETTGKITDSDILNKLAKHYYPLIMSKRKEFCHEYEIRLISPINLKTKNERFKNNGKFIKINLKELITEIIISPSSTEWFSDLVKNTVNLHGLSNIKVYKSRIYDKIDE